MDTSILRCARPAQQLTSQGIADLTKLPLRTVAAIADGRLDQLPRGFYGRAYVRIYADALGLDSDLIRPIMDAIPRVDVDLAMIVKCRETSVPRHRRTRPAAAVDAAAVDLAIVAALSACGVLVCAALTADAGWDLPAVTIAFLTLAAPMLILYFGLLGATGVGTAGACLFHVDFVPDVNGPIDGTLLLRRTCQYLRSEAAALLGKPTPRAFLET